MSDTYFISTAGSSHPGRRLSDAIWGHCVGDLLGLPVEFSERTYLRHNPVIGPRAFGTFHQPAGTWTDDTSLTLCLLDGLNQGLDYNSIMKNFSEWLNSGKFTPHGITFDIGRGTCEAIRRFDWGIDPLLCGGDAEQDNGNGALMRILPALFFLRSQFGVGFVKNVKAMSILHNICALTHRHPRSHVACGLYLAVANQLLEGLAPADAAAAGFAQAAQHYAGQAAFAPETAPLQTPAQRGFRKPGRRPDPQQRLCR